MTYIAHIAHITYIHNSFYLHNSYYLHIIYITLKAYNFLSLSLSIYIYIYFEYIKMVNKYYQKNRQRLRREARDTKISLKK